MSRINEDKNPLGLIGIDALELCCDKLGGTTEHLFEKLGFTKKASDAKTSSIHLQQNRINYILSANNDPHSHSRIYYNKHGEGVHQISFGVKDIQFALDTALKRGASLVEDLKSFENENGKYFYATIKGFGDVLNQFVQRPKNNDESIRHYLKSHPNTLPAYPLAQPLLTIDHLTNNVPKGEMEHWVDFYQKIYGFEVTRYFDIKGLKTGLLSKVVQLVGGNIIIPINEPEVEGGKSQIQEFLDRHNGAGVQHMAFTTTNIIKTVKELRQREFSFLSVPDTYYEDIVKRNFKVTENLEDLRQNAILADGDPKGYLLQIFSDTYIGPSFFEFIQRKNHTGFGEGNFQALFDSIERDQMQRGYLV